MAKKKSHSRKKAAPKKAAPKASSTVGTKKSSRVSKRGKTKTFAIPSRNAWRKSEPAAKENAPDHKATEDYSRARDAYYKYGRGILEKLQPHGVIGVSYGPRLKGDISTSEITIRVHVATKTAKRELKKHAKEWGFKKTYGGVGTDIVVWDFTTSAASEDGIGQVHTNGTRIECGDSFATLGTKVVFRGNQFKAMWITAAHLVSPSGDTPTESKNIVRNGTRIGSVSPSEFFHNSQFDVAFIEPASSISIKTSSRVIGSVFASDQDVGVRKVGASTGRTTGSIKLLDYDGTLKLPTGKIVDVVDHFLVEGNGGKFAAVGDSGAIVIKDDNSFIGVVRGADKDTGIGVVTRLSNILGSDDIKEFRL